MADGEVKVFDSLDEFLLFLVSVQLPISLNPGPRYAIEENTFTSHITGYPTPVVAWKNYPVIYHWGGLRYNNSALQISQVCKEDSDVYTCSGKNL